jgi:hypothetical protein
VQCLFIGGVLELLGESNWNGTFNTFQLANLYVFHGARLDAGGTMAFFDCTTACIDLAHEGRATLQNVRGGSGNTSYIIALEDPGCIVNLLVLGGTSGGITTTGLTATTSLGDTIVFLFTPTTRTFDYIDMPRFDLTYNAGILGG